MKNWGTKRNVFIMSVCGSLLVFVLAFIDAHYEKFCRHFDESGHAIRYCETMGLSLSIPTDFSIFLFSFLCA
jgi:hypothetical protein